MKILNEKISDSFTLGSFYIKDLRRKSGNNFACFSKYYFKHRHTIPDAEFHRELRSSLSSITKSRGEKLAIAAPRGSAKSTILEEYVLHSICHNKEKFILVISNTTKQAENFFGNVKYELETNPLLMDDFPEICWIGKKSKSSRWARDEIITRNGIRISALSANQAMRGIKYKEHRPTLIIMDDLEPDQRTQSLESCQRLENEVKRTILNLGSAETNYIYVGTIHCFGSFLGKLTSPEEFPSWQKKIYKSVVSYSKHPELWQAWSAIYWYNQDFKGQSGPQAAKEYFEVNKEAMLEGAKELWQDAKSYYDLMIKKEEDPGGFDSEMQNDPINPQDCHFNPEEIRFWDDKFGSEEELIKSLDLNAQFYGAWDPSMGKQNKYSDFSAIITVVKDAKKGIIYVLDAEISRKKPDEAISYILAMNKMYKYEKFGVEANNFQELIASNLNERSQAEGSYINIKEIKNSSDKAARIESLQPMVKNKSIMFCKKLKILLDQMKYYKRGCHDDGLDALEMAVRLCKEDGRGGCEIPDIDVRPPRDGNGYCSQPIYSITLSEPNRHERAPGF